jgi:perosamine synthetase
MPLIDKLALLGGTPVCKESFPLDDPIISKKDIQAMVSSLESKKLSIFRSPEVALFEKEFSNFVGCSQTIFLTSCTVALHAALLAVGVKPGNKVAVPAYTYVGSAMPVLLAGAEPVFIDIELDSYGMDPGCLEMVLRSERIDTILLVHLFGIPAKETEILSIARAYNIPVVHDCAQALGTRIKGNHVGIQDVACFSFGDSKILKLGEGGAVSTSDSSIAKSIALVRHEGEIWKRADLARADDFKFTARDVIEGLDYITIGSNYRPTAISAALARTQLSKLSGNLYKRLTLANFLRDRLSSMYSVQVPKQKVDHEHSWISFPIVLDEHLPRNTILAALCAEGIPAGVHFPVPIPYHSIFRRWSRSEYSNASFFCNQQIVLPVYPTLTEQHMELIIRAIEKVLLNNYTILADIGRAAESFLSNKPLSELCSGVYFFY